MSAALTPADLSLTCSELCRIFKEEKPHFKISGPYNATIKNRQGAFRKTDLIGGEEFVGTSAYVGKRGSIILTFKPNVPTPYVQIEMSIEDAGENLDSFAVWYQNFMRGQRDVEPTAPIVKQDPYANPAFASW